ncbi:MAG: cold shock domain-containing protein [Xenococcaceae cyanobacterium]
MKPIRCRGQLLTWKDDRGFGFIKPDDGSKKIFLHISAFKEGDRRPKIGDTIFYEITIESDGKIRASNASIEGVKLQTLPTKQKHKKRGLFETVFGIGTVAGIALFTIKFSPSSSTSLSKSNLNSPITSIAKPGCIIKGNISIATEDKFYHIPGMEDYESTIIDPAKGERWFCTESEAIANGWHKAPR